MNQIEVINETEETIDELKIISKLLEYAVDFEKLNNVTFNVIIVHNDEIHKLNREYRHIDRETDVITFALEDEEMMNFSDQRILGDIYISVDKARSQAEEYGHSFLRELAFLTVHGFYHLLGYDHMTKEDENIMFERQERVLDGFGIKREI